MPVKRLRGYSKQNGSFAPLATPDRAELKDWHPAQVPGVVQTDLLRDGLIPDPFYQDNDTRLQWIGLTDWEYRTTFQADAATLAHDHVDLVFDGLDTYADVYVNDQAVLHSDNMFRRWRVPVKTLLKVGPNTLRVVFHSPIESMIPKVKALPYISALGDYQQHWKRRRRRHRALHSQGALSIRLGLGAALCDRRNLAADSFGDLGRAAHPELSRATAASQQGLRRDCR